MNNKFLNSFKILRPYQWHKNFIIFAPIFFSAQIDLSNIKLIILGLISFCILSSSVYIFNDLFDIEKDRQHHKKKLRPIASGKISRIYAFIICAILVTVLFSTYFYFNLNTSSYYCLLIYLILNILYTLGLKNIPVLELFLVSSGFVIRLIYGALIINVSLSNWIIVSIGLLSMLLVIGKRRSDIVTTENQKQNYSIYYLDLLSCCISAVVMTSYLLFCLSDYAKLQFGNYTIISSVFVIYAILHYLRVVIIKNSADDPSELVLKDPNIYLSVILWISFFIVSIYFY